MATIVLAGTFDSKGLEYEFVRKKIINTYPECEIILIDVAYIRDSDHDVIVPNIEAKEVASRAGCDSIDTLRQGTRDDGYKTMSAGLALILKDMYNDGKLHGILGLGGTCGSSILTAAMRELPLGLPKVMISTAASTPASLKYYGLVDLILISCVTDIFGGVNSFNKQTIENGAVAVASMAKNYWETKNSTLSSGSTNSIDQQRIIGISMIGAVMPCVQEAFKHLQALGYQVAVFSAVGTGGRLMEKLVSERKINGVLDITLMELNGEYLGGTLSAGPERLEQAAATGTPQVVSLGGLDCITLGVYEEAMRKFPDRYLYRHNDQITVARTSPDECRKIATIIAKKLNKANGPCAIYIPKGGLTYASKKGGDFYDPEADEALFSTLKANLDPEVVHVVEMEEDINSKVFAIAMANALHAQIRGTTKENE